uniref:Protein SAMBA n=1 Tax=Kalanchoe fedtschenkoi TaxID=63787 RepID=A0A7N0UKZ3_KALFE
MNGLSPAHSSLSTTATAGGGGNGGSNSSFVAFTAVEELHFPADLVSAQDRKDEALADLKAQLDKVVKSMDEDSWIFEGPRSRIHLISRPGTFHQKQTEACTKSPSLPPSK